MSEIGKLKQEIDKQREISKSSHLQSKTRILSLERKCSSVEGRVDELQGQKADLEELMERVDNIERGLKNLWSAFKEAQHRKAG